MKNSILALAYETLGVIAMQKQDFADAETNFQKSADLSKAEPMARVYLRLSVAQDNEKKYAEALVNAARPPRTAPTATTSTTNSEVVEEGMKLPRSVLDACLDSFTAADENRVKASTKFFADTGLMALLCRHDRVLWLANMTTAGERQYYAIALITKY